MIAVLLTLAPLFLLILAAYRGVSVILFAPVAAMLAADGEPARNAEATQTIDEIRVLLDRLDRR